MFGVYINTLNGFKGLILFPGTLHTWTEARTQQERTNENTLMYEIKAFRILLHFVLFHKRKWIIDELYDVGWNKNN